METVKRSVVSQVSKDISGHPGVQGRMKSWGGEDVEGPETALYGS